MSLLYVHLSIIYILFLSHGMSCQSWQSYCTICISQLDAHVISSSVHVFLPRFFVLLFTHRSSVSTWRIYCTHYLIGYCHPVPLLVMSSSSLSFFRVLLLAVRSPFAYFVAFVPFLALGLSFPEIHGLPGFFGRSVPGGRREKWIS